MNNPLQQYNKRELILPYSIEECVERIRALRYTLPSPHSRFHKVRIKTLDEDRFEFVLRQLARNGVEETRVTGYLTPQGDNVTHVKIEANASPLKQIGLVGLAIYGLVTLVSTINSPESLTVALGIGFVLLIGYLVGTEVTSSTNYALIDLVMEQLQELDTDYQHKPKQ